MDDRRGRRYRHEDELLKRQLETTRLLLEATKTLSASISLHEVLTGLAAVALEFTGLTRAFVNLIDMSSRTLVPMVATGGLAGPVGPSLSFDELTQTARDAITARVAAVLDFELDSTPEYDRVIAEANQSRLILFVPLLVGDELVGHISLDEPGERHAFTERDIELVQSIASQASLVVRNARLFEAERAARDRADRELQTTRSLLDAAEALAGLTEPEHVFTTLVGAILTSTDHSRAAIETWDPETKQLCVVAVEGGPARSIGAVTPWNSLDDAVRDALDEQRTNINDFDARRIARNDEYEKWGRHLALQVPITYRDRLLGLITVDEPGKRRPFSDWEIQLIEGIAAQAAVAMENARLFSAEQQHANLADALAEIDKRLHSSLDREEMVRCALAEGASALGADTSALSLYREGHFVVQRSYGFDTDISGYTIPEDKERHSMLALRTKESVFVEDTATDSRVDSENMSLFGIGAVIVVPLVVSGEGIGNLYFNFARPRKISETERDFVRRLGASLSLAIDNARLLEVERRSARINGALTRIDRSIHATLERDEMLRRVAVESAGAIGADSIVLALRDDDDRWVIRYAYNMQEGFIGESFTVKDAPFIGIAIETQQPVAIDDAYTDTRANAEIQRNVGIRAVMAAPLIVRDEVIGGVLFNYSEAHEFDSHEIRYASRLASSVGLAIANIRLYEAERDIADRLQSALLTLPSALPGVEFAHSYHSATEAVRVGGDFYDIFQLNHQYIGITIGDVSGKGLDAAAVTSLVKHSIRAHATERGKTPAQVLELTNEVVYRSTAVEAFATVFFGMLDCRDGRLVYANAGHTAAVVIPEAGELVSLGPTGPILGAFKNATFHQAARTVDLDALLFLYTDGLIEARLKSEQYGEQRLLELLQSMRFGTVTEMVDQAVNDVVSYTQHSLHDDIAVLAVRRVQSDWATPRQQRLALS